MRVHLIAACGVGMSALAGLLREAGLRYDFGPISAD